MIGDEEIQIDKTVPVPTVSTGTTAKWVQLLKDMDIGDSFRYPLNGRSAVSQRARMHHNAETAGVAITIRAEGETFRVWKTSNQRKSRSR